MKSLSSFLEKLTPVFTVDLRALALMRISVGLVAVIDLLFRLTELKAHYSDEGVVPREMIFDWNSLLLSIHFISGKWEIQLLLFMAAIFFGIKLILGKNTTSSTILFWALTLSLHNRNLFVLQGGDDYLRMLLFWGMFIPWGRVWSLDAKTREPLSSFAHASFGSAAYVLQVCLMYFTTGFHKTANDWTTEGSALYYSFHLDQYTNSIGKWFLNFPDLLEWATFGVLWFERLGWILLLIPFIQFKIRMIGIVLFFLLHLGIDLTMMIGIFPYISYAALLGMLAPAIMNWVDNERFNLFFQNAEAKLKAFFAENFKATFEAKNVELNKKELDRIDRYYLNVIVVLAFTFVTLWNVEGLLGRTLVPDWAKGTGILFRIDQRWRMFSPEIKKDDGWFVMEATLQDGSKVDIFQPDEILRFEKPENVLGHYKKPRWRKFFDNWKDSEQLRYALPDYLCREWENEHPDRKIETLKIIYVEERLSNYRGEAIITPITLMNYQPE